MRDIDTSTVETKPITEIAISLDRIAKVLSALLLHSLADEDQTTRIMKLRSCGFTNGEIAELLHTTPLTVKVTVSQQKSKFRRPGMKKRPKTP